MLESHWIMLYDLRFYFDLLTLSLFFSVSEMAMRILWDCLVDDPTLFFRTFFEEITKANKQVHVCLKGKLS